LAADGESLLAEREWPGDSRRRDMDVELVVEELAESTRIED